MISEQNIERIKEIIYNHCINKKWCAYCAVGACEGDHKWYIGTLKIGGLMTLYKLIDIILMDTSKRQFRLYEACIWLNGNGYIEFRQRNPKTAYGGYLHFATPKLYKEMQEKAKTESKEVQQKFKGDIVYA